jgi:hypothetical protein
MKSLLRVVALVLVLSATYGVRGEAAGPVCYGTCTVQCADGTYTSYRTAYGSCCEVEPMCPGATMSWSPGPYWQCAHVSPYICLT